MARWAFNVVTMTPGYWRRRCYDGWRYRICFGSPWERVAVSQVL